MVSMAVAMAVPDKLTEKCQCRKVCVCVCVLGVEGWGGNGNFFSVFFSPQFPRCQYRDSFPRLGEIKRKLETVHDSLRFFSCAEVFV